MELFLTIIGLFGIPSIYFGIRNIMFKQNIEFHKILQSFPLISKHKINDGTKTVVNDFTNIQMSKEFTEFVETKRSDLDEFLAKLERFDDSKLKLKKQEIKSFISNIKKILTSKATNMQVEVTLNAKTNDITTKTTGKQFEWCAFNYIMVDKIMKNKNKFDKLFVCKFLKF